MRKKIFNMIWVMGVLAIAVFCLSACDNELDIQTAYPFKLETMPIPGRITKEQTVEIRCTLVRQGRFADTRYSIRYFQYDGTGVLRMDDGTVLSLTTVIRLNARCSASITPPLLPMRRNSR